MQRMVAGRCSRQVRRRAVIGVGALSWGLLLGCRKAEPAPLRVAGAANFAGPLTRLADEFRERTGQPLEISTGSTGKLYAQIVNGAPFDVLLSADAERPQLLERAGLGVPGSRFTYALGRLALYGKALRDAAHGARALAVAEVQHLAIANPRTAPYGVAAEQVLRKLGVYGKYEARLLRAENVSQALQFVQSGGAELGLLALSTLVDRPKHTYWVVPDSLHDPIRQDAILLSRAAPRRDALGFLRFLRGPEARAAIVEAGYGLP